MKIQPLWGRVPFCPRLTPSPRGSPARGGWGRTENPSPVGRSLSWENSTAQRSYPLGRQGGQEAGASLGSGKETPAASDFSFCLSTLRLCSPGAPREELSAFRRSAGCAHPLVTLDTALLCPRDPVLLRTRTHSPEAMLPEP